MPLITLMRSLPVMLVLGVLMQSASVSAHPMPTSRVEVRILEEQWHLQLQLPTDRLVAALEFAGFLEQPADSAADSSESARLSEAVVKDYIVHRVAAHSLIDPADPWSVHVESAAPSDMAGYWTAQVVLGPPAHVDQGRVNIEYKVIGQEIITHAVDVVLIEDGSRQGLNDAPEHLTTLRARRSSITFERE